MRPAEADAYCPTCDGLGHINGTAEEEEEFERARHRSFDEYAERQRQKVEELKATVIRCSFCQQRQENVARLISSPASQSSKTYICDGCVVKRTALRPVSEGRVANPQCSFCSRRSSNAAGMFVSPSDHMPESYICAQCIKVCVGILNDEGKAKPRATPSRRPEDLASVDSVRWCCYKQEESAREALAALKSSCLGGPGRIELRYAKDVPYGWWVVLYNIVCGGGRDLSRVYDIPGTTTKICGFATKAPRSLSITRRRVNSSCVLRFRRRSRVWKKLRGRWATHFMAVDQT